MPRHGNALASKGSYPESEELAERGSGMMFLLRRSGARVVRRIEELRREEGQGLVEYALILVLVSIVSISILAVLGLKVSGVFNTVTNAF
jgi:pilus assembly protein Flp/PilA